MKNWINNVGDIENILRSLAVTNQSRENMSFDEAFNEWKSSTVNVRSLKRKVFLVGNGASASMASHMAADLAKNAHVHTEVFSDLSLITAIANDISFEDVFAEPIRRRMNAGDMLIAISSSGSSPNIIKAVDEAKRMGGYVVTLSAMAPENELRKRGMLNFYVPASSYGLAETCHAAILHHWMDYMERTLAENK